MTFQRKRQMRLAANNNTKITSFFPPTHKLVTSGTNLCSADNMDTEVEVPGTEVETPGIEAETPGALDLTNNGGTAWQPTPMVNDTDNINTTEAEVPAITFLDMIEDDNDAAAPISVLETVKKLIIDVKKYKSFTPLFYLTSLKQFINLWGKYKVNPQIKAPMVNASRVIAASVGKGPYMARKIRSLYKYVARFHTLPPTNTGKHHTHPSLLNNEWVAQAVRQYLTVVSDGEV